MAQPDIDLLIDMANDGISEATDGCEVETDSKCEHGHSSWLLVLGWV